MCESFEGKGVMSSSIYMYLDAMPLFEIQAFFWTQCMDACSFYQNFMNFRIYIALPKIQINNILLSQSLFYFILYMMGIWLILCTHILITQSFPLQQNSREISPQDFINNFVED